MANVSVNNQDFATSNNLLNNSKSNIDDSYNLLNNSFSNIDGRVYENKLDQLNTILDKISSTNAKISRIIDYNNTVVNSYSGTNSIISSIGDFSIIGTSAVTSTQVGSTEIKNADIVDKQLKIEDFNFENISIKFNGWVKNNTKKIENATKATLDKDGKITSILTTGLGFVKNINDKISSIPKEEWERARKETEENIRKENERKAAEEEKKANEKPLYERIGATIATGALSFCEGAAEFGETLVDGGAILGTGALSVGTGLFDGGQYIYGKITGNDWSSATKSMWEGTKSFVEVEHIKDSYDDMYENTSVGDYLKNTSYQFDRVRTGGVFTGKAFTLVASVLVGGEIFGAIGGGASATSGGAGIMSTISSTSGIGSLINAISGLGSGSEDAWNDGADLIGGIMYGTANGAFNAVEYYLGAKAGNLTIGSGSSLLSKIGSAGARIGLDGLDGFASTLIQTPMQKIYKNESIGEIFASNGGWTAAFINAGLSAGLSALGQLADLKKYKNGLKSDIDTIQTTTSSNAASQADFDAKLSRINEIKEIMNSNDYRTYKEALENGYAQDLRKAAEFSNLDNEFNYLSKELADLNIAYTNTSSYTGIDMSGEKSIKLENRYQTAEYFNDPKQYMYQKVIDISNSFDDPNMKSLASQIQQMPVSEIDENVLYRQLENYLSPDETSLLNKLRENSISLTDEEKELLATYTKYSGPAVTAYQRGTITSFKGHEFDGTNIDAMNNYINRGFKQRLQDTGQSLKLSEYENVDVNEVIHQMDTIIDKAPSLSNNVTVYRGVDGIFKDGVALNDFNIGAEFNDTSFVSTSALKSNINNNHDIMLEIELPEGSKAAYIESFTGVNNYSQQEVLLSSNSKFKIVDKYIDDNNQLTVKAILINE